MSCFKMILNKHKTNVDFLINYIIALRKHFSVDKTVLKYLKFIREKKIKQVDGARLIGKSVRQVQRMLKKYVNGGGKALIHGNRGKESQRRIPKEVRVKITDLYKKRYLQYSITHFTKKLAEDHEINICRDTVRSIINSQKLPQKKIANIS